MVVFPIATHIYTHPLLSQMPLTQRLSINTGQIGAVQAKALKYMDMGFVKLLLIILESKGQNVLYKRLNRLNLKYAYPFLQK